VRHLWLVVSPSGEEAEHPLTDYLEDPIAEGRVAAPDREAAGVLTRITAALRGLVLRRPATASLQAWRRERPREDALPAAAWTASSPAAGWPAAGAVAESAPPPMAGVHKRRRA
jgi:hypothetical protein